MLRGCRVAHALRGLQFRHEAFLQLSLHLTQVLAKLVSKGVHVIPFVRLLVIARRDGCALAMLSCEGKGG